MESTSKEDSSPVVSLQQTLSAHASDINSVNFAEHVLVTCSSDKTVRLWSLDDYSELPSSPLCGHTYSVHCGVFTSKTSLLATCSTDGKCIVWDIKSGDKLAVFEHVSKTSLRVCEFSPEADFLLTGSDDEKLCIWDLRTRKLFRSLEGHEASVVAATFSPDGAFIVSGSTKGDLRIWDAKYGHGKCLVFNLEAHDLGVTCAVFSPTYGSAGNIDTQIATQVNFLLATCGFDNTVKLWDILAYSGSTNVAMSLRDTFVGHKGPVMSCCFSPDGKLLASGSSDKTVRLWSPLRGVPLFTIEAHSRFVTSCAFSRDASLLATGSNDKTVKVWRVCTVDQLADAYTAQTAILVDLGESGSGTAQRKPLLQWSTEEVCVWLHELDMGQYESMFRRNAIDGEELATLTHDTMTGALGIDALGHRNKLLRSIQQIKENKRNQSRSDGQAMCVPLVEPGKSTDDGVPDEYLCPITREVMRDPVIASDGYTYERAAITDWMKKGKTNSPMTNAPLPNISLTPNRSLKMLIQRL